MSAAETSVIAHREHAASGAMGRQARQIYDFVRERGGDWSRKEISRATGIELSAVCGRVNGLVAVGLLDEYQQRPCRVTGRTIAPVGLPREPQRELFAA